MPHGCLHALSSHPLIPKSYIHHNHKERNPLARNHQERSVLTFCDAVSTTELKCILKRYKNGAFKGLDCCLPVLHAAFAVVCSYKYPR